MPRIQTCATPSSVTTRTVVKPTEEARQTTTTDLLAFLRTIVPLLASRAQPKVVRVPALRTSGGADIVPLCRDDFLKESSGRIGIHGPHEGFPLLQPEAQTRPSTFNERGNVQLPRYRRWTVQRLRNRHPSVLDVEPVR